MGPIANWFASGAGGIAGMGMIVAGTLLTFRSFQKTAGGKEPRKRLWLVSRLFILTGLLLILFSSASISAIQFRILGIFILALAFCIGFDSPTTKPFLILLRVLIIGGCLFFIRNEWKMWKMPSTPPCSAETLYVVGDSLSAGIGFAGEKTWIDWVREERPELQVVAFAAGGATLDYAIEKSSLILEEDAWVILEIGGNDILNGLPSDRFKEKLDALFRTLCRQNRTVIMFELPLPPFANLYGYSLRQAAARYGVRLVPRRILSDLITGKNTCDGLHFSNEGHRAMADVVLELLRTPTGEKPAQP
jgi:acyl-CoA thioesterase-1